MNSRGKILSAIRHSEPDGLPVDLGSTPSSGISAIAYSRLNHYLGFRDSRTQVYDVVQQLAQPEDHLLERYRIDALDIGRTFNHRDSDWYHTALPDGTAVQFPAWFHPILDPDGWNVHASDGDRIATMPSGATFFDQTCFPYANGYPSDYHDLPHAMSKVHWACLAHSPWDHANEPDFWDQLRQRALTLRASSDRALTIVAGCNLFEWGTFLRRIDNFLVDLIESPTEVERLLDALMEIHLATLEKVCHAVGDIADILRFGDDLGTDRGPFMSPRIYRELFKPRHSILVDYVKKNSQMHPFLHSCGSIYRLLPDLIEAGYEIINPVQTTARDMAPERLKKEFGSDITFWGGGCDTRRVLNKGTPQEVREHVQKTVEILAPGGGFVFNTIHNIMPDVPPENIEAMFAALEDYR